MQLGSLAAQLGAIQLGAASSTPTPEGPTLNLCDTEAVSLMPTQRTVSLMPVRRTAEHCE